MADYTATITLTIGITARNEEKAQERAEELSEAIQAGKWGRFKKPWINGDLEEEVKVEEA